MIKGEIVDRLTARTRKIFLPILILSILPFCGERAGLQNTKLRTLSNQETSDLQRRMDLYQNPEGRDRRPRWPRRGYELKREIYGEAGLRVGIKTRIMRPLQNLGVASVDRLGLESYIELEFKVGRVSTLEIIGNNIDSMIEKNSKGELVFGEIPPGDTVALCEEELYLERDSGLVGRLDVLGSRLEGTLGLKSVLKITQTTGMLDVKKGQGLSYYKSICENDFYQDQKMGMRNDLTKMAQEILTFSFDDEKVCIVPQPSKDYMDLMGIKDIHDYNKTRQSSDPGCEEYGSKISFRALYGTSNTVGRCVNKPTVPVHAGYCEARTVKGGSCPLFKNTDGSITDRPQNDQSERVTESMYEAFCDESKQLRCVLTQEGGWFKSWYQAYRPYRGECKFDRCISNVIPNLPQPVATEEALPAEIEIAKERGSVKIVSEDKWRNFFNGPTPYEASGVVYSKALNRMFAVFDNSKDIAVIKYNPQKKTYAAKRVSIRVGTEAKLLNPPFCKKCSRLTLEKAWRSKITGFEGISYNRKLSGPGRHIFYAAVETINVSTEMGEKVYMPAVAEIEYINSSNPEKAVFQLNQLIILDFQFVSKQGRNKGIEGIFHVQDDEQRDFLFLLCEGKSCNPTKYKRQAGGQLLIFRKITGDNNSFNWFYEGSKELRIPGFTDFSGLDIDEEGNMAVVSQEKSSLWLGKINFTGMFISQGSRHPFPLTTEGQIGYCNVEGVSWVSKNQLIVVSDETKSSADVTPDKKRAATNCLLGQQSIHLIEIN